MADHVLVIGKLWLPVVQAAMVVRIDRFDMESVTDEDGKVTRDSVERWLLLHATGDFQFVDDFAASVGGEEFGWKDPDNQYVFDALMEGEELW